MHHLVGCVYCDCECEHTAGGPVAESACLVLLNFPAFAISTCCDMGDSCRPSRGRDSSCAENWAKGPVLTRR